MKKVQPIRDKKMIKNIKNLLRSKGMIRELLLFQMGLVTALRMGDMLKLRMSDITDESGQLKALIIVKEQKTGKTNRTEPTKNLKAVRDEYKLAYPQLVSEGDNFVFFRSKSKTGAMRGTEGITVKQGGRIITSACKSVGLIGSYSSHSLRKSFGYQARVSGVPIEKIQQKLNHSSPGVTLDYIGITQDELDNINHTIDL